MEIKLGNIKFLPENEEARERTLEAIRKYKEADEELERLCKELGIEKPELVCRG